MCTGTVEPFPRVERAVTEHSVRPAGQGECEEALVAFRDGDGDECVSLLCYVVLPSWVLNSIERPGAFGLSFGTALLGAGDSPPVALPHRRPVRGRHFLAKSVTELGQDRSKSQFDRLIRWVERPARKRRAWVARACRACTERARLGVWGESYERRAGHGRESVNYQPTVLSPLLLSSQPSRQYKNVQANYFHRSRPSLASYLDCQSPSRPSAEAGLLSEPTGPRIGS
jgi:hypothetical protein